MKRNIKGKDLKSFRAKLVYPSETGKEQKQLVMKTKFDLGGKKNV